MYVFEELVYIGFIAGFSIILMSTVVQESRTFMNDSSSGCAIYPLGKGWGERDLLVFSITFGGYQI